MLFVNTLNLLPGTLAVELEEETLHLHVLDTRQPIAEEVAALRGPTVADRMLAALLFGTTGVGVLLLLAHAGGGMALLDVALVLAGLAAIAGVAFARRGTGGDDA